MAYIEKKGTFKYNNADHKDVQKLHWLQNIENLKFSIGLFKLFQLYFNLQKVNFTLFISLRLSFCPKKVI